MSAAEPATPNPRVLTTPDGAAVIDITKRTTRKAAAAARGRWQAMNDHQPPGSGAQRTLPEQFADEMEAAFYSIERSLTNDETALVFRHTLAVVERALEGAEGRGIIDEQQRHKLTDLLEGMKEAPGLL